MKVKLLLVAGLFCLGSGCNVCIHGTWGTESVIPKEAAKEFKIATVTFKSDDTFTAVSQYGKEKKLSKGTYFYDGFKLKLRTDKGKERVYGCMKVWDKLDVTKEHEGRKIKVVMAKPKTQ